MLYIVFTQRSVINSVPDQYVYFHSNSKVAVACGRLTDVMFQKEAVKAGECGGWFTLIWEGTFIVIKKCWSGTIEWLLPFLIGLRFQFEKHWPRDHVILERVLRQN